MTTSPAHRIAAGVAALLGVATLVAGARVLLGGNPGYAVVRPVLMFNTAMGALYVVAAALILRGSARARSLAWFIAEANAVVLLAVIALRLMHRPVATETLAAMAFRTAAWFAIVAALRHSPASPFAGIAVRRHPEEPSDEGPCVPVERGWDAPDDRVREQDTSENASSFRRRS